MPLQEEEKKVGSNPETNKIRSLKHVGSPTKSVKNKSLPSNKFNTTTKIRTSMYGSARYQRPVSSTGQKGVAAVKSTTSSKSVAASTTPERSQGKKACSTPTSDEITLSDLTLDASCISKRPGELDDTVTAAPIMKIGPGSRSQINTLRKKNNLAAAPKLKSASARKPGGGTVVSNSVLKEGLKTLQAAIVQEDSDPDEVTEEMMDKMYTRYIQAKYIEMKCREAKEKAEEDAKKQILTVFFATEELRIERQKLEERKLMKSCLANMRKAFQFLEDKLAPLMEKMSPADERLDAMAKSMEKVKHNLVVQGIQLSDPVQAATQMEKLSAMLVQFIEDAKSFKDVLEEEEADGYLESVSEDTIKLHDDYARLVDLVGQCNKHIKMCEVLALQEASLKISLGQLEKLSADD